MRTFARLVPSQPRLWLRDQLLRPGALLRPDPVLQARSGLLPEARLLQPGSGLLPEACLLQPDPVLRSSQQLRR